MRRPSWQQVPYERVKQIIDEVKAVIGPVFMVRALGGPEHLVVTKTHDMPVTIALDANNDIAGFFFKPPIDRTSPIEDLLAAFDVGVPYSYLVMKDGEVLYGHEEESRSRSARRSSSVSLRCSRIRSRRVSGRGTMS